VPIYCSAVQLDPMSLVLITAAVAPAPIVSAAVPVVLVPTGVVEARAAAPPAEAPA
jgi:hypothetical protein